MTSKEQKKVQKAKARKDSNVKKLLEQRSKIVKARQDEATALKQQKAARRAEIEQQRLDVFADQMAAKLPEETRRQIEHNIEILKALEEEYEAEMQAKFKTNAELEEQGYQTLEEKVAALLKQNQEINEID